MKISNAERVKHLQEIGAVDLFPKLVTGIRVFAVPAGDVRYIAAPFVREEGTEAAEGETTISIASETPVRMFGEDEILLHDEDAVDFSRLMSVGAILKNHDPRVIVGVPTRAWIGKDRKSRVAMRWGSTDDAKKAKTEVLVDKTLRGVSVGYKVDEWIYFEQDAEHGGRQYKAGTWLARRWSALEASFTPIPADPNVGAFRSLQDVNGASRVTVGCGNVGAETQGGNMKRKVKLLRSDAGRSEGSIVEVDEAEFTRLTAGANPLAIEVKEDGAREAAHGPATDDVDAKVRECLNAERKRIKESAELGKRFGVNVDELVNAGASVEKVRDYILGVIEERQKAATPTGRVTVTEDGRVSYRAAAVNAIRRRAGALVSPEDAKVGFNEAANMSLVRLAEDCLVRAGMRHSGNTDEIVALALRGPKIDTFLLARAGETIAVGTSDFPYILANVANKEMLEGIALAPVTYPQWCKIGSIRDFKAASRLRLSDAGKLAEVPEFGNYKQTKFGEQREQLTLKTYGESFNISRQAIINDDLQAFTDVPRALGRAAAILPNDLAVKELLANGTMSDGAALFVAATHKNYSASSSYALTTTAQSIAGIGNLCKLLLQQTALQHKDLTTEQMKLRLMPKVCLIPPTGWQFAFAALSSTSFGSDALGTNPLRNIGIPQPVIEPSLEDSNLTGYSTTAYYLFADPRIAPIIEVAFLNGVQTPYMEEVENNGTAADGRVWKVRMDCIAGRIDWRGACKENGA